MPREYSTLYTIGFAAAVCFVCSILVATSAVTLRERQEANQELDRKRNVLLAAGMLGESEELTQDQIISRFDEKMRPVVVDLKTGQATDAVDAKSYDQRAAVSNTKTSFAAPANDAGLVRLPNYAVLYQAMDGDRVDMLVLPVRGKGLWSTLYGFLALDADTTTVRGIAFYEHAETPGLGGEISNPKWQAVWHGRKVYNESWEPVFEVIKGKAGTPEQAPHKVDGMSGATLTGNGVTNLIRFWLGDKAFGPYLAAVRKGEN